MAFYDLYRSGLEKTCQDLEVKLRASEKEQKKISDEKSDLIVEIQNFKAASDELESKIGAFEKEQNSVEEFKKDHESIEKEIKDRDSKLSQLLKDKSDLSASLEAAMSDLEANQNQLKLVQDEAAKMEELTTTRWKLRKS